MKRNFIIACLAPFVALGALCFSCLSSCAQEQERNLPPGYNPKAISVNSIAPDRGLADPHTLIVNDTLYAMCGHDRDWDITDFCRMDRWEMWSTADLKSWNKVLEIDSSETYIGDLDQCWAGDLATKDGKYYWYFSNKFFDTGVMVAPSIKGPWRDALGKPLLPAGIIGKGKPYDPEIYMEEDGTYSIIFGAGQYWIATLGDDMISLEDKPQKILVQYENGERRPTGDKPCIFRRGDWFYLMWGEHYAMARELRGPYTYKGEFIHGGHGTVFEWTDGQWYSLQEQHETNAFYRGVQLRPLYFNEDGTVYIPENNWEYPLPGRDYNFLHSRQGWRNEGGGASLAWNSKRGAIEGDISREGAIVASVPFLHTPIYLCRDIRISLDNKSAARELKIALYSYDKDLKPYTRKAPQEVDWSREEWLSVPIKKGRQTLSIPLSDLPWCEEYLHQIALQPAADVDSGSWCVEDLQINAINKVY